MTGQQIMKYVPYLLVTLLALLIISTGIQIYQSLMPDKRDVVVYICDPECRIDSTQHA